MALNNMDSPIVTRLLAVSTVDLAGYVGIFEEAKGMRASKWLTTMQQKKVKINKDLVSMLVFCTHEVAVGLHHLGTCNILHRVRALYRPAPFLCNGGKSRLCVLDRRYAGTA